MNTKVYDDNGNEVFQHWAMVITPIAYLSLAKTISSTYLISKGVEDFTNTLPTALTDGETTTHHACISQLYDHQIDEMVAWIAESEFDWCADSLFTIDDDATEIKSKFGIICGESKAAILNHLELSEVN